MSKQLEKVSFEQIRYANCWEDPFILIEAMENARGKRILSIASAGDNTFSLLTLDPEIIVAVDVSKVQLFLVELKKVAILNFDREKYLQFAGFSSCDQREDYFIEIKNQLSEACANYWTENILAIKKGIIYNGKFEKFFLFFAHKVLPYIHSKKKIQELFRPKSAAEQKVFFYKKWNTFLWRLIFPSVFNKRVFGNYARDPEFMKHVETTVPQFIKNVAEKHYQTVQAHTNPFLWFFLTGSFGKYLPHYVREENYEVIRSRMDKVVLHEGLIEDGLKWYPKISGFNLSNIFEYMDPHLFELVSKQVLDGAEKGAVIAYWNLMITRRISEINPKEVSHRKEQSERLKEKEHGYFYKNFIIDVKL
jgi:S-adenosylmethionine-diacylglycerol 3-amino-3-carboxypropyl transferase